MAVMAVADDKLLSYFTVVENLIKVTSKHIYMVSKEWSAC